MSAEPAFLLHRRPTETSALVDLLTLHHGRIRAVAQGGQRPSSKSRQRLQPFTPLLVTWRGERELKRLTLMESRGQTALLAGEGLLCGFYANEIATRLLPLELPAGDVFAFIRPCLKRCRCPLPARSLCGVTSGRCWRFWTLHRASVRPMVAHSTLKHCIALMHRAARLFRQPRGWMVVLCAILTTMTGRNPL